jgi:hypothetical protein
MNKLNLLFIISIVLANSINAKHEYYQLKNEVIHLLDGIKEAMDGPAIWDIELVRWHIRRMQVGKFNKKSRQYTGVYTLKGQQYSIQDLATMEAEAEKNNNAELLKKLDKIQDQAVHEFIGYTEQFIEKTHDTKHLIIQLMNESCKLRNRVDSPILTWTETNGDEEKIFRKTNKNLQEMNNFFTHLNDFLGDLVESCPKGKAQFKKLLNIKKTGNA